MSSPLRIRALTMGLPGRPGVPDLQLAGSRLQTLAEHFQRLGYEVQSKRIALRPWAEVFGGLTEVARGELLAVLDRGCADSGIDACSLGTAETPEDIAAIGAAVASSSLLNGSAAVRAADGQGGTAGPAAAARVVKALSAIENGFGNFRFAMTCHLGPYSPFFPGAYHGEGSPTLSIGFENSGSLVRCCEHAADLGAACDKLGAHLSSEYDVIEREALAISDRIGVAFAGIDTSIAPSLNEDESLTRAYQALGVRFGAAGTLAVSERITRVLKQLPVRRVGYCGLMLSLMEDVGLARAAAEGRVSVATLLACSGVCGVGVDMVPVPGATSEGELAALMRDVVAVSTRLTKPLSVRVLPVPGASAGDRTSFDSPYVCDTTVLSV